jgi:hypothetical protein
MCIAEDAAGSDASPPDGCIPSETSTCGGTLVPSNGLGPFLAQAESAPALVLTGVATISTIDGTVTDATGSVPVSNVLVPGDANTPAVRVFIVGSARIDRLVFEGGTDNPPAFALVSAGEVVISGGIDAAGDGTNKAPGSRTSGTGVGDNGTQDMIGNVECTTGGGGGGGATPGGEGGRINGSSVAIGQPGMAIGSPELIPLVGGGAGGAVGSESASGGGAVHIVSGTSIRVIEGASANVGGAGGIQRASGIGGGGAGGGLLLEAWVVDLDADAILAANGGSGASGTAGGTGSPGQATEEPALAPSCGSAPPTQCARGGAGGTAIAPQPGGTLTYVSTLANQTAGGGGGAAGHIRINVPPGGALSKHASVVITPPPTMGVLGLE